FYAELREHSREVARGNDDAIRELNDRKRSSRPALQMIFSFAAVIIEQHRFAVQLRNQKRRSRRKQERKIRRRENMHNVEARQLHQQARNESYRCDKRSHVLDPLQPTKGPRQSWI